MLVTLGQLAKASLPIDVTPLPRLMLESFSQFLKVWDLMEVRLLGRVMLVKLLQPANALSPMKDTFGVITIPFRLRHAPKADSPMKVREFGSETLTRFSH